MKLPTTIRKQSTDWVLQFINIVFLLLLYFLVNGTIAETQPPGIALPVSLAQSPGLPPHDAVYISKDGVMAFRGVATDAHGVAAVLGHERLTTIVADKDLSALKLVALLDELRKAGASGLTLVTDNRVTP